MIQKFWETMPFSYKVNIFLSYDPLIPSLHFQAKQVKLISTKAEKVIMVTLFMIVKI